ncbi:helix-turn-helix transcriptional regulator [Arabiibacter massiliensis]|uniref:helix-turn-helix transcriptional regulator n=1 Tax=Arabiibacter massiliensis TaxID=1870985 RepID=UPI0009BAB070|nr:helix-turn-helix transcriptional regulator [Arabiibacter massiliensis]
MTDILATAAILAGVGATFCGACHAIARAAYFDGPAQADLLLAFFRVIVFAAGVIGCLALTDLHGESAAALFAVVLCIVAFAAGALMSRSWRAAEERERSRVAELRSLVDRLRTEEDSVEARCARAARAFDLTRREEDMLGLLLEGRTRAEIARELFVSSNTVKTHIRNLYRKMGVADKDELVETLAPEGGGAAMRINTTSSLK